MNNKAQASLEYLMTYGWALIIIATIIGVLIFIITPPASEIVFTSSQSTKILLKGSSIEGTTATLILQNITGGKITNVSISSETGGFSECEIEGNVTVDEVGAGSSMVLTCLIASNNPQGTVTLSYIDAVGLDRETIIGGGGGTSINSLCETGSEVCSPAGTLQATNVFCNSSCSGYNINQVTPGKTTLSEEGATYMLLGPINNDVDYAIEITAKNIILDCQSQNNIVNGGITLSGISDSYTTIRNCTVENDTGSGIVLAGAPTTTLENNTITNCIRGISISGSGGSILRNNTTNCGPSGTDGVFIIFSPGIKIYNHVSNDNFGDGIELAISIDAEIYDSEIKNNGQTGILVSSSNNTSISRSTITENNTGIDFGGMDIQSINDSTVCDNTTADLVNCGTNCSGSGNIMGSVVGLCNNILFTACS